MVDTLSSQSIANLDASPVVANTSGVGARGEVCEYSDYVTPTAAGIQSTSSLYKMVRLPLYIKVKELVLTADAHLDTSSGLSLDVGAYWSDSTVDGTPASLQGTQISANCFAAAIDFHTSFTKVNADTAWTAADRNKPLWQALGLSSGATGAPPVGFVDVVIAVHTGATTGVSNPLGISVKTVW